MCKNYQNYLKRILHKYFNGDIKFKINYNLLAIKINLLCEVLIVQNENFKPQTIVLFYPRYTFEGGYKRNVQRNRDALE